MNDRCTVKLELRFACMEIRCDARGKRGMAGNGPAGAARLRRHSNKGPSGGRALNERVIRGVIVAALQGAYACIVDPPVNLKRRSGPRPPPAALIVSIINWRGAINRVSHLNWALLNCARAPPRAGLNFSKCARLKFHNVGAQDAGESARRSIENGTMRRDAR